MEEEYYSIEDASQIPVHSLVFSRSLALHRAINQHRDFSLVAIFHKDSHSEQCSNEILVVDVCCDGVPPSNHAGIRFSERLAISVPKEQKSLIEVFALRKSFPILMHQNAVKPGTSVSLCLYQEPSISVARTWTAPAFLKRIQNWLEQSSRGSLHSDDQPVERLFYPSPFELVLPWNFNDLRADPNTKFRVYKCPQRPNEKGFTFRVLADNLNGMDPSTGIICLDFQPTEHGIIENDFGDLGDIADALLKRGIDIISKLTHEIRGRVGSLGINKSEDSQSTLILVSIPIARAEGESASDISHRAYFGAFGLFQLGESIGAIHCPLGDGKYYNVVPTVFNASQEKRDWRSLEVMPVEVHHCIDRSSARLKSGTKDEGPKGVLIGAGALGSALLEMWTRSGWGEWTIIDHDHIKPHNLVRHIAVADLIGRSKVDATQVMVDAIMKGAITVNCIHADACDQSNIDVVKSINSSSLVIDASTILDYPRFASMRDDYGRHASVFVTPDGCSSVLLLEDSNRKSRLRTLESQYYRALIGADWGENHLQGNMGTFWSGASCRDLSFVMPYSDILGHASIIASQVPRLSVSDQASIQVWTKDPLTGAVANHSIEVQREQRFPFDGLDVYIDDGVCEKMRSLRSANLPNETGGILLGYHDFNINSIIVTEALPAPRDSRSSGASFARGLAGVIEAVADANKRTAGIVSYIGEWHSHPSGHGARPSTLDKEQLIYLTTGMGLDGLPAVMLIVGEEDFCVLKGECQNSPPYSFRMID
jgi:hypothetical protein